MEHGTLTREIRIEATPDVVFDVVSRPEHIAKWWSDDASFEPVAGATGELVWGERSQVAVIAVVDVRRPSRFSFRWTAPDGQAPDERNSLLVVFELEPAGDGTLLRLTESGWREKGWDTAVLEEAFHDHEQGWNLFLPRLQRYAPTVVHR